MAVSGTQYHPDFLTHQRQFERVLEAIDAKQAGIEKKLKENDLDLTRFHILFVAYKQTDELIVYAKSSEMTRYRMLESYPICGRSGEPGPKRKEGDGQVPEGFYHIDRFNPKSKFHLSLGINYPNESDRKKSNASNPGGDIFIHGSCASTGCIPVTDDKIKEIYLYAIHARNNGQEEIPVYIFPFRMTDAEMENQKLNEGSDPELFAFWSNLKVGHDLFAAQSKALNISFTETGEYQFNE